MRGLLDISDILVLFLNPFTVACIVAIIVARRYQLPGFMKLTRVGLGVLACGLAVQWLIAFADLMQVERMLDARLWVLKDIGIFILFTSIAIKFNVGTFRYEENKGGKRPSVDEA